MINWMRSHGSAAHLSDDKVGAEDVIAFGLLLQKNLFECPCGFSGKAKVEARGSIIIAFALACLCIVPGLLYGLATEGYRAICPSCGRTLAERI